MAKLTEGTIYRMGAVRVQAHNEAGAWVLLTVPLGWGKWSVMPNGEIWQQTPGARKKAYATRWHVMDLQPIDDGQPVADR